MTELAMLLFGLAVGLTVGWLLGVQTEDRRWQNKLRALARKLREMDGDGLHQR